MKAKIITVGLAALAAGLATSYAQPNEIGRVLNANSDLYDMGLATQIASRDNIYGTARTTAMGGAFTSLGADLSSVAINPAGLGMYQTSDWGISTALSLDAMSTRASGGAMRAGGRRVSATVNNFGAAWNLYDGSGALTSVTMGITYNRAANFNSRTRISTSGEGVSIGQAFAGQLNYYNDPANNPEGYRNYDPGMLQPEADPFWNLGIGLPQWGAVLGQQTGLVGLNDDGYYATWEDANTSDATFTSRTRGGVHETSFALGFNLANVVYLGGTLGSTFVNYIEHSSYGETYNSVHLSGMTLDQNSRLEGNGVMARVGVIVRPVEALRIGVAFHSPTFYTLTKRYDGFMTAGNVGRDTGELEIEEERFNTSPRLSAGISGTIAGRAIVAVDVERTWHNKMRYMKSVDSSLDDFGRAFKPAATVRAGVEVLATEALSLRAGGVWMQDIMREKAMIPNNPLVRGGFSLTGGAGFRFGGGAYVDVAYVYNRARMTDYELYFFGNYSGDNRGDWVGQFDPPPTSSAPAWTVTDGDTPRTYTSTRHRHMLTLTLGQRF